MCNLAEYGSYRGKGLMGTAKSGWYSAYTSGAYKKRHPAAFVKRAVKDAINGKEIFHRMFLNSGRPDTNQKTGITQVANDIIKE